MRVSFNWFTLLEMELRAPAMALLVLFAACASVDKTAGSASGGSSGTTGAGGSVEAGVGGAGTGGTGGAKSQGPTRYPTDGVTSPITESVALHLRAIAARDPSRQSNVFMKVGDSHTVSKNFLYCFAGGSYTLDLDGRDALLPSIEHFRAGSVMGTTPFDRASLAASVGKSANWAIAGSPTPLAQELSQTNPRFAFVSYGSNDMQLGVTFESAIFPFYSNMMEILDELENQGVVPIVTGLPPRADPAAALWVETYDVTTRGIAEARQIPYYSIYLATRGLADQGLLSDGLHENVYASGGMAPCVFTEPALGYGYNVRNLASVERLDAALGTVVDSAPAPDADPPALAGKGSASDPFVIDTLPFTHAADTTKGSRNIDAYSGCNATQNESGPEQYYELSLDQPTAVRVLLFDRASVNVDLHVLTGSPGGASCVARADRSIERTLPAGKHTLVVDTFTDAAGEHGGAYLLVVVRCEPGDAQCQ